MGLSARSRLTDRWLEEAGKDRKQGRALGVWLEQARQQLPSPRPRPLEGAARVGVKGHTWRAFTVPSVVNRGPVRSLQPGPWGHLSIPASSHRNGEGNGNVHTGA